MPSIREEAVERIRRDHEYMLGMARRIKASCTQSDDIDNCSECRPVQREVCHGNIEHLIRAFVEVTMKHNLIESLYMEDGVPQAHRIAHNQAHVDIAEQMRAIRVVLTEDGDRVVAIEGIDSVLRTLLAHFDDYDRQLESYLLDPA